MIGKLKVVCGCMVLVMIVLVAGCKSPEQKAPDDNKNVNLTISGNDSGSQGNQDSASEIINVNKVSRTAPAVGLIEYAQKYQETKSQIIVSFLDRLKTTAPEKLILHAEQIRNSNDIIVLVYDEKSKYASSVPAYVFNNNYYPDGQKPAYYRNVTPKILQPLSANVRGVFMGVFQTSEVVHGTGVLVEYHKDLTTLTHPDLTTEFRLHFH